MGALNCHTRRLVITSLQRMRYSTYDKSISPNNKEAVMFPYCQPPRC